MVIVIDGVESERVISCMCFWSQCRDKLWETPSETPPEPKQIKKKRWKRYINDKI